MEVEEWQRKRRLFLSREQKNRKNILFTVPIESERKIQDFRLSWNGMLCKRIGRYLQCFDGKVRYCRRRMYAGRKVFSWCVPMCRSMRISSCYDDQWRSIRTFDSRWSGWHFSEVWIMRTSKSRIIWKREYDTYWF